MDTPLGVVPPLPAGYTYENMHFIPNGVRMNIAYKGYMFAEATQEVKYAPEYDDPVGLRYKARVTNYTDKSVRPFNNPNRWVEYPDMETMVGAVLARHRIGIKP